jgi:hypothetical protein
MKANLQPAELPMVGFGSKSGASRRLSRVRLTSDYTD